MKYDVEIGSDPMIHIPSFIMIGSGIPKLISLIHRNTTNMQIAYAYFYFLNKESKQKYSKMYLI
jgi:hypothetical protein